MAFIKYLFLAVMATAFSLVENAPSTINNRNAGDELQLRLVFVNRNDENTISNAPAVLFNRQSSLSPIIQKSRLAKTELLTEPVFAPLAINAATRTTNNPRMDDERQNWGLIVEDKTITEDESFYNRPLSLPKIIKSKIEVEDKPAKVTSKPAAVKTDAPMKPSACDTAVITCCAKPTTLKQCFETVGCPNATEDMLTHLCSDSYIKQIIDDFARYYKRD